MFYLIIVLLVIVLISIVFALIKRGNRVIYILTILFVFVVGIISFKFYPQISSYISQNKISVEKSKIEMIQNYINDKYDGEYKVTKSNFTYNGDGITGGIFMYSFDLKNDLTVSFQRWDNACALMSSANTRSLTVRFSYLGCFLCQPV